MILYVKNKLVTLRGSSFAVDENNNKVFEITGKFISPTRKKFVKDLEGNTLFIVRNKFWHFITKKALIYDGNTKKKYVKVKDRIFSAAAKFTNCKDNIEMVSNGIFKGLTISINGNPVAKWSRGGIKDAADFLRDDNYTIEVYDESKAALLVAITIAIDNMWDEQKQ